MPQEPLISFVDGSTMAVKIVDSNSPPLIDRVEKFVEGILSILDRFPNPSLINPPSRSIVFLAGGGNFIPAESWSTQRNYWRFSHARFREDLDASSSSSTF